MKCLQVAADLGMENDNLACDQKQLNINGAEKIGYSCHIFGDEPNCKINYTRVFYKHYFYKHQASKSQKFKHFLSRHNISASKIAKSSSIRQGPDSTKILIQLRTSAGR